MSADAVTVFHTVDGAVLTKRISRREGEGFRIEPYDRGYLFSVERVPVDGIVSAGRLIGRLQDDPKAAIIRGAPAPGTNLNRCRRLLYPQVEDGEMVPETFLPAASQLIAADFDNLPVPIWNPDDLACRRKAIERDRIEHPHWPPKGPDDGEDYDLEADGDPAPVDAVRDWALVIRAAVSTLPQEFHDAHAYWQMTSSAGISEGIRCRVWFWLSRPVSDDEAKRWLGGSPVDLSLYNGVQFHYTARPIFNPPSLDPVPLRGGFWWRHVAEVPVPELPEPPPPPPIEPIERIVPTVTGDHREIARQLCLARADLTEWELKFCSKAARLDRLTPKQSETLAGIADPLPAKAERYADAALRAVETATQGERHPTLLAVAVRLYSLVGEGLLDPGQITQRLLAAGETPLNATERHQRTGGGPGSNEQALDWARARATAEPDLPEGFRE